MEKKIRVILLGVIIMIIVVETWQPFDWQFWLLNILNGALAGFSWGNNKQ